MRRMVAAHIRRNTLSLFRPWAPLDTIASYNYKLCMKGKGGGVFLMVFEIINSY